MHEITLASKGDIGLPRWFRVAVEGKRFYPGEETDSMKTRMALTLRRIMDVLHKAAEDLSQNWIADQLMDP
eukprot:1513758-Heterocapsa_arctica.AAC.1